MKFLRDDLIVVKLACKLDKLKLEFVQDAHGVYQFTCPVCGLRCNLIDHARITNQLISDETVQAYFRSAVDVPIGDLTFEDVPNGFPNDWPFVAKFEHYSHDRMVV